MKENLLFSVLMANYNNAQYIQYAIDSVRKQTYDNWEIIIVDDGSTDDSKKIYESLKEDPRIHIYMNDENHGCGYTKARCAELAHGEVCGFLDPDDALTEDAIEKHIKAHLDHPKASVVYSKAYYCDTDFNILDKAVLPDFSSGKTYFDYRWEGCMHFTSYKKSYYDMTCGINPNAYAGVDQDLYFLIEEVGEIVALDEFCYYYVIKGHEHSIATDDNNYFRLWYWNLEARRAAVVRRGLDVNTIIYEDMHQVFDNYVAFQTRRAVVEKEYEIRSSMAYRIGKPIVDAIKFVVRPFMKQK